MAWVSMTQAASCLGVSVDTIRRRLHRGELQGKQKPISQGFAWLIEIPDEVINENSPFLLSTAFYGSCPADC
jgi:hypothetical protein